MFVKISFPDLHALTQAKHMCGYLSQRMLPSKRSQSVRMPLRYFSPTERIENDIASPLSFFAYVIPIKTRFRPNRVAADMEGNREFDFLKIFEDFWRISWRFLDFF